MIDPNDAVLKAIEKDNPNKFCFLCGKENDLNNFAFTEVDGTFHIICLPCKWRETND